MTHYDTIGISPNADREHIRRAYLKKARTLHPDQLGDRPQAEQRKAERRMQELNAAWSVLSDPKRRASYDKDLAGSSPRATGPVQDPVRSGFRPFDDSRFEAPVREPGPDVASDAEMELGNFATIMRIASIVGLIIVLGIVVLIAIVVLSGGPSDPLDSNPGVNNQPSKVQPTGVPQQCVNLQPVVEPVSCEGPHDALVWKIAPKGTTCPSDLEGWFREDLGGLYCVTRV